MHHRGDDTSTASLNRSRRCDPVEQKHPLDQPYQSPWAAGRSVMEKLVGQGCLLDGIWIQSPRMVLEVASLEAIRYLPSGWGERTEEECRNQDEELLVFRNHLNRVKR